MIKRRKAYLITGLFITILFLMILSIKGIYPFGKTLIGTANYDNIYVPMLDRLHDILRGKASLLYDFHVGSGTLIYNDLVRLGIFNPLNLLVYFVPRSYIGYFGTYLILIKLVLASFTSLYMIRRIFMNLEYPYQLFGSILYTLGGFTLLNLSNLNYLDVVYLLPLIITGLYKLFNENKNGLFVFSLTLSMIFNFVLTLEIMVFIVIISYLYSFIFKKKNKVILNLIYVLLFSAFIYVPSLLEKVNISTYPLISIKEKLLYILPLGVSIFLFIKTLFLKNKHSLFFLSSLLVLMIPVLIKPINVGGLFSTFDTGILLIMLVILGALYYLSENTISKKVNDGLLNIAMLMISLLVIYITYTFRNVAMESNLSYMVDNSKQIVALLIIFVVGTLLSILCLFKDNKYIFTLTSILLVICFSNFYITTSDRSYVDGSNKVKLDIDNSYKVKDDTASIGDNISYLLNTSSISYFNHFNVDMLSSLGYTKGDFSIYNGGTILSDILLGNKYTLSYRELPESLYKLVKKDGSIYLYESIYNLSFGVPCNENSRSTYKTSLEHQNVLTKELFNKEYITIVKPELSLKDIKKSNNTYYQSGNNPTLSFEIKIKEPTEVYLNMGVNIGNVYGIKVDGETIKNPIYSNRHNTKFPASEQNILYLGEYSSDIHVEMGLESIDFDYLNIGLIKLDDIKSLANTYNIVDYKYKNGKIYLTYNNAKYNKLFLPVNYSENVVVTNNDKIVKTYKTFDNFISIVLEENNEIEINYNYKNLLIGLSISLGSLLLISGIKNIHKKYAKKMI